MSVDVGPLFSCVPILGVENGIEPRCRCALSRSVLSITHWQTSLLSEPPRWKCISDDCHRGGSIHRPTGQNTIYWCSDDVVNEFRAEENMVSVDESSRCVLRYLNRDDIVRTGA